MHCSIKAYSDFHDDFMNERITFYALLTSISVEYVFISLYIYLWLLNSV